MRELSRKAQKFNNARNRLQKLLPFCFYDDEEDRVWLFSGTMEALSDFLIALGKEDGKGEKNERSD